MSARGQWSNNFGSAVYDVVTEHRPHCGQCHSTPNFHRRGGLSTHRMPSQVTSLFVEDDIHSSQKYCETLPLDKSRY